MNKFLTKIKSKEISIGTILTINTPIVAEILSLSGYDWILIDMEHSSLTVDSMQNAVQVLKNNCSSIVRIPNNDDTWIKKVLDTGCNGIIVPQVNSKEEVIKAINSSKYPPLGTRSVGISRAHKFGLNFSEYVSNANNDTALIIQIEHIKAIENIDDILSVKGIDGVFIGPYDLSGSIGKLGKVSDNEIKEKVNFIKEKCKNYSIPVGIFVATPKMAKREILNGFDFVVCSIDSMMLINTAKSNYEQIIGINNEN